MISPSVVLVTTALAMAQPEAGILDLLAPVPGGLTVGDAMKRALAVSPTVRRAEAGHLSAVADADSAYLGFVPRFDFSANYRRLSKVDLPMFSGFEFPQFLNTYGLNAQMSVPASTYFLTVVHAYRATKLGAVVAKHQMKAERASMGLRAVDAFLATVRARAATLVAQDSVRVLTAHLEDVGRLVDAGLATKADRMQLKAQLAQAQVALRQAEGAVQVGGVRLRRMVGAQPNEAIHHGAPLFTDYIGGVPEFEVSLELALKHREELKALERVVEIQRETRAGYRGLRYPVLSLSGAAEYSNPNQRVFPQVEEFRGTWQLGVSLSWSPNDFVSANSDANGAEQNIVLAQADLEGLKDAVAVEVSAAVNAIRTAMSSVDAGREGLSAATQAYDDRVRLLAAGAATTQQLLDSESALRRAQLTVVNAFLDLRLAEAQLLRAQGNLLEPAEGISQ